jgi:hypothetical protein
MFHKLNGMSIDLNIAMAGYGSQPGQPFQAQAVTVRLFLA